MADSTSFNTTVMTQFLRNLAKDILTCILFLFEVLKMLAKDMVVACIILALIVAYDYQRYKYIAVYPSQFFARAIVGLFLGKGCHQGVGIVTGYYQTAWWMRVIAAVVSALAGAIIWVPLMGGSAWDSCARVMEA